MAFPLRGVEIISLVLKICHCEFNCPKHVCSVRDSMRQLGVFPSAQRCEMISWHLVYRLELSGTISRPVATAWTRAPSSFWKLGSCRVV